MADALPEGWAITTIGGLGHLLTGQSPISSTVNADGIGTPYVSGPDQWNGAYIRQDKWTTSPAALAPEHSVFITVKGSGVGTLFPGVAAAIGRDIYAFEPHGSIDFRFMYRALQFSIQDVITKARGDIPGLSRGHVLSHAISVPGPKTQLRVASKIDELFSHIDEGEQALKRVEKLVERYRQSVLKAAVTGELTRDWREARKRASEPVESGAALLARILKARRAAWESAELAKIQAKGKQPTDDRWKQKYKEPVPPDTTDLPELPEGWVWASMDQVGFVSGGLTKNQRRQTLTAQRPYLRVANVYANRLDLDDVQRIGVDDGELDRVLLEKGDLLVVEGNGSIDQIGRVAIWDGSIAGCVHQNHLIKVRCTNLLPSWYALIWCLSPLGREHIRRIASSTAGLHTLSISKVASLPIPVPTLGELDFIQDRFDQATALVVNERQSLRQSRATSAALRQSILKAAFAGQLVPQDPNDEPASKLLERIAAERVAAPALRLRKKKFA